MRWKEKEKLPQQTAEKYGLWAEGKQKIMLLCDGPQGPGSLGVFLGLELIIHSRAWP